MGVEFVTKRKGRGVDFVSNIYCKTTIFSHFVLILHLICVFVGLKLNTKFIPRKGSIIKFVTNQKR